MISWLLKKIFGDRNARVLRKMQPLLEKVNALAEEYKSLTDAQLQAKTDEFKARLKNGETTDQLLPEAYATVKDACRRLMGKTVNVTGHDIVWDMVPFDVQILGAIALHHRNIAEMATGEGKTLVAIMPLYLNALTGRNVQLVTVNDYLARRDSQWMGFVLKWLGLTVGCLQNEMNPDQRRQQYACDVTYGTNSEFGFDYLRDMGMAVTKEHLVQRDYFFAIVDEIDSILIDEARTPLIIAGPAKISTHKYGTYKPIIAALFSKQMAMVDAMLAKAKAVIQNENSTQEEIEDAYIKLLQVQMGMPKHKGLMEMMEEAEIRKAMDRKDLEVHTENNKQLLHDMQEDMYFTIDERNNEANLCEKGRNFISPNNPETFVIPDLPSQLASVDADKTLDEAHKMEKRRQYQIEFDNRSEVLHNIAQLLKAYCLFEKDTHYIVQDNKVIIVDEFTGRPQPGRRFSEGLHQALEAKENVKIERETQTLASITIQNYFRMYEKLAGMTGTAETEANEFKSIYNLDVVVIPTNKPCRRIDMDDRVYKTQRAKYNAIINEIIECNKRGQPVLVGTISVEVSEILSKMLKQKGVIHNVLNAKHHQSEAEIVARAGQLGAVTIATNMAGRGTDIKLGPGVLEKGGLHVIGSERHDARRIDRQLRGRCARQGDPGSSRFYVSFEDNLMRLFASDRIAAIMGKMGLSDDDELSHPLLNRTIESSQKKVEQQHFAIRKHTLEYDDVINRQRASVYEQRRNVLMTDNTTDILLDYFYTAIGEHVDECYARRIKHVPIDFSYLKNWLAKTVPVAFPDELFVEEDDGTDYSGKHDAEAAPAYAKKVLAIVEAAYNVKCQGWPDEMRSWFERSVMLSTIDSRYQDHLYAMDALRQSVHLRSYGQRDPLVEYKQEAFKMFNDLMTNMTDDIITKSFRLQIIQMAEERADNGEEDDEEDEQPTAEPMPVSKLLNITVTAPQMRGDTFTTRSDLADAIGGGTRPARPAGRPNTPITRDHEKIGPNAPCPCGSGKKYKKCCGRFK